MEDTRPTSKTRQFANSRERLDEADHLETVYSDIWDDERAISNLYNGRDTTDECEARKMGRDSIVNHLFAYDNIATSKAQLESTYNASPEFIKIEVTGGVEAADERKRMGMVMTAALNKAIKRSRRFKGHWQSLCGDVVLFGRGVLAWESREDWLPRYVKPLVPMGSGTAPEEIPYAIIPRNLTLAEVEKFIGHAEASSNSYWNIAALRDAKKEILKGTPSPGLDHGTPITTYQHEHDAARDEGTTLADATRLSIPVYYVYEVNPDGTASPVTLTIVARHPKKDRFSNLDQNHAPEIELFHQKDYYKNASECILPFILGTANGGETKYHTVLGLGRLNYSADVELEEFFNDAMTGSREQLRRLYRVSDAADIEEVTRWAAGEEYSNIIPDGVQLEETPKNGNFPAAFTIMEQLRQVGQRNAQGSVSNTGGQDNRSNELEVQALQRQSRDAQVMGNKMADFAETCDMMAMEMTRRFLQPAPSKTDRGYREIKFFQDECQAESVPLALFRKMEFGFFKNIKVTINRVIGDGDRVKEIMANRALESRMHLYPPESQKLILRHITASDTRSFDLAAELVPLGDTKPEGRAEQQQNAHNENDMCDKHGITGFVPDIEKEDVHPTHLSVHMMAMASDIKRNDIRPWDDVDVGAFSSKFQHATAHVGLLPEDESKEAAKALAEYASAADKILAQLEQRKQQEAQAAEIDPAKVHAAQIANEKLKLDTRKQENLESERDRRFELDANKAASTESINNARLIKEEDDAENARMRDKFNAASTVRTHEQRDQENDIKRNQAASNQRPDSP